MEDSTKYVTLKRTDYLMLVENEILVDAMKIAGIENTPMYKVAKQLIENGQVDIKIKPLCIQNSTDIDHE